MKRLGHSKKVALSSVLTGLFCVAGAGAARAQDPPPPPPPAALNGAANGFGLPGQIAISGELQLALIHTSAGNGSGTTFEIQPAGDYFVAPNISLGGLIGYGHGSTSTSAGPVSVNGSFNAFIIGVRGGYAINLTPQLSLWPTLTLGYEHTSTDGLNTTLSENIVPLQIYAPLLLHVVPHLFIGFGPLLTTELVHDGSNNTNPPKETAFGLQSTVGGYFGL